MENKIPVRFFIITILWSWCFWGVPIILNWLGLMSSDFFNSPLILTMAIVGTFGPMIGACVSLHTIEGKGSVKNI